MTSKTTAIISGAASAVLGLCAYVAAMPPATQDAATGFLTNLFPVEYRGTVGNALKALSMLALYTSVHYAANSGPQTPPVSTAPTLGAGKVSGPQ